MTTAIIGLIVSALLYWIAIYAFVWTGERRMRWGAEHGVQFGPAPKLPSFGEVWKRHSVEMTLVYAVIFGLLALMGFTIWGRVAFAALGALVFGSQWLASSPHDLALPGTSSLARASSKLGYWFLAVFDWFGYLSFICFAAAIVVELFTLA